MTDRSQLEELLGAAALQQTRWRWSDAHDLLQHAVAMSRTVGVRDTELPMLNCRRMLVETLRELGQADQAWQIVTPLLDDCRTYAGPAHPVTLCTAAVAGAVAHDLGDLEEAARLYHRLVDTRLPGDAAAARAVMLARVNLALLHRDRGNLTGALAALVGVYAEFRRQYGSEDLDTIRIAVELADLYRQCGDLANARRLLTVAHASARHAFGDEHRLTGVVEAELEAIEPGFPPPVDPPQEHPGAGVNGSPIAAGPARAAAPVRQSRVDGQSPRRRFSAPPYQGKASAPASSPPVPAAYAATAPVRPAPAPAAWSPADPANPKRPSPRVPPPTGGHPAAAASPATAVQPVSGPWVAARRPPAAAAVRPVPPTIYVPPDRADRGDPAGSTDQPGWTGEAEQGGWTGEADRGGWTGAAERTGQAPGVGFDPGAGPAPDPGTAEPEPLKTRALVPRPPVNTPVSLRRHARPPSARARRLRATALSGVAALLAAGTGAAVVSMTRGDSPETPPSRSITSIIGATLAPPPGSGTGGAAAAADRAPGAVEITDEQAALTVTWTDPVAGPVPVVVAVATAGDPPLVDAVFPPGTNEHQLRGLDPGRNYCVVVAAYYEPGEFVSAPRACTVRPDASPR